MVIRAGGEECTCGRRGCFEAYASATALIRETKRAMAAHPESRMHAAAEENGAVDGRTAFIAAQRGDAAAQAVVDRYLDDLACGVANIVNIFFPEVIALSGGVANQGDTLLVPLRERVRALSYGSRYAVRHTRIELCTPRLPRRRHRRGAAGEAELKGRTEQWQGGQPLPSLLHQMMRVIRGPCRGEPVEPFVGSCQSGRWMGR